MRSPLKIEYAINTTISIMRLLPKTRSLIKSVKIKAIAPENTNTTIRTLNQSDM